MPTHNITPLLSTQLVFELLGAPMVVAQGNPKFHTWHDIAAPHGLEQLVGPAPKVESLLALGKGNVLTHSSTNKHIVTTCWSIWCYH